jgi:hypothetical protein
MEMVVAADFIIIMSDQHDQDDRYAPVASFEMRVASKRKSREPKSPEVSGFY